MSILVERLSAWALQLEPDIDARVSRLISPVPLASLLDDANAGMVVAAWTATREHKFEKDPMAWALLFATLRDRFAVERVDLTEALRAQRMNLPRTRLEIHLQGGARLYEFGMDLLHEGSHAAAGRLVLQEAIATYELVESGEAILNERQRCIFRGMRGVARLTVARQDSDPGPLLEAASVDLEISEALGDHSAPHFAFLAEAYLRQYDLTGTLALISQAEKAVARGLTHNTAGRATVLARADCSTRRGFQLSTNGDYNAALSAFQAALADYSLALSMPVGRKGTSDELVQVRQGQVLFQLYCSRLKLDGTKDQELLDRAIDDLRVLKTLPSLVGSSLAQALLRRAEVARDNGDRAQALADAAEAAEYCQRDGVGDLELRNRAQATLGESEVWLGLELDDRVLIRRGCERLLELPADAYVSIAALSHGVRQFIPDLNRVDLVDFCVRASSRAEVQAERTDIPPDARRFCASHGGSLLWSVARIRTNSELVARANRLFRLAIEVSPEPAAIEVYAMAGDTALRLARLQLGAGERQAELAVGLFEDACDLLMTVVTRMRQDPDEATTVREVVAYSKLGEAYTRLHAITRLDEHAETALEWLGLARQHGNETPEVIGLLGDVHYRRGRLRKQPGDLTRAIALKNAAFEATQRARDASATPPPTNLRENRSVAAAATSALFALTRDPTYLADAIECACQAAVQDGSWPWPLMQLSEFAAMPDPVREAALRQLSQDSLREPLVQLVASGDASDLRRRAAHLAVHYQEFGKKILGGRQKVYVLSDPHRLLQQSLVLKPTPRQNAEREWEMADGMRRFLREANAPESFLLPEPLAIVDLDHERAVYVMRRATGRELGSLVTDWRRGRGHQPLDPYRDALRFLALFHGWQAGQDGPPRPCSRFDLQALAVNLAGSAARLKLGDAIARRLRNRFIDALPTGLCLLRKKDAHPENWLIGPGGEIVMMDLEASARLPVFFEVAQLLDDYPLCPTDDRGWSVRLELASGYLRALAPAARLEDAIALEAIMPQAYAAFVLSRAVFGLARLVGYGNASRAISSSSAVHNTAARIRHATSLIEYLADAAPNAALMSCAADLASAIKRTRP
jgi:hypothetical protein